MQHATTVVSFVDESHFLAPIGREVLSLQVVRNWLACLGLFVRGTITSDSKMGGLSCLIELLQWFYVRAAHRDYDNSLRVLRAQALVEEECI